MTNPPDIDAAKSALRSAQRAGRRGLAAGQPDAAARAAQHLSRLWPDHPFGPVATVALYRAMGSELDPAPLGPVLERAGCAVTLPAVVDAAAPLVFRTRTLALVPDLLGVQAPDVEAAQARPDLIVAPLLAFDRSGARLGQGGGFYDRTLAALRRSGRVFALGLAYDGQEVDAVPVGAFDQRLDGVLTETGLRLFHTDA